MVLSEHARVSNLHILLVLTLWEEWETPDLYVSNTKNVIEWESCGMLTGCSVIGHAYEKLCPLVPLICLQSSTLTGVWDTVSTDMTLEYHININ